MLDCKKNIQIYRNPDLQIRYCTDGTGASCQTTPNASTHKYISVSVDGGVTWSTPVRYIGTDGASGAGSTVVKAIDVGAKYLITSCPKCLSHFNCYLNEHKELKDKIKVIDIISFLGERLILL